MVYEGARPASSDQRGGPAIETELENVDMWLCLFQLADCCLRRIRARIT